MRCLLAIVLATFALAPSEARGQAQTPAGGWLHAADVLAASDERADLERALDAYAHAAAVDANPTRALRGRAWVLFLLDRTTESVAAYVRLLDALEPGPARDEALVMLAAMLADPDWDRDGAPDGATALTRLADPALVPQDRAWLAELYFETAHALYLSSRDPTAIAVLDAALSRWPAPAHGTPMDAACHRHRTRPTTLRDEDTQRRLATDAVCARHAH